MSQPSQQTTETPIWRNGLVIAALLCCCFPVGLYLIWTHPNWSTAVKSIWTGIWLAIAIPAMVNVQKEEQAAKQELAEAHQLWKSGQKAEAAAKYKRLMAESGSSVGSDRSIVLSHIIDYEATEGDVSLAKKKIADALDWGDSLYLESKQAKALLDEARAERERVKRAEALAQSEEDRGEPDRPEERRKIEREQQRDDRETVHQPTWAEKRYDEVTNAPAKKYTVKKSAFRSFTVELLPGNLSGTVSLSNFDWDKTTKKLKFKLAYEAMSGYGKLSYGYLGYSVYDADDTKLEGGVINLPPDGVVSGKSAMADIYVDEWEDATRIVIHRATY